jgi:glycosyltransferase involved in cell wall biosynthesis
MSRAVVASTVFAEGETAHKLGLEAYSYPFVARAFLPLLRDLGEAALLTRPESSLDHALWRHRRQGREPLHLSFMPLHAVYFSAHAPNACLPFWEYPDVPDRPFDNSLRHNWVHIANYADLLLTACTFTRRAFERAGVRTPIHVVPVPARPESFAVPPWQPGQRVRLDCPCYVFPHEPPPAAAADPWLPQEQRPGGPRAALQALYRRYVRPRLPGRIDASLTAAHHAVRTFSRAYANELTISHPATSYLDLSGVVFTTILNPCDRRKNLDDLLSAFLLALADCEDATLVVKLVLSRGRKVPDFNLVLAGLRGLGVNHRCRVVFVADYLTDEQMVELTRASTFYVTATHAEGACLPLQDYLAAGRPGIAPVHTSLADYFSDDVGLTVESHPEPTYWPGDPRQSLRTTWHRTVWQSLCDQFRAGYTLAREEPAQYRALADAARRGMRKYASAEAVRPRLVAALDSVADRSQGSRRAA